MGIAIGVIGAGAMGTLLGGLMAAAGSSVDLIEVDPVKVERIRSRGVEVLLDEGVIEARPGVKTPSEAECCYDAVIILVKAYHTRDAAQLASTISRREGVVLTLQNGLGNVEILREYTGSRAHAGSTTWGATLLEPGRVSLGGRGIVFIQEPNPGHEEVHSALVNEMEEAGLNPRIVKDIGTVLWRKVIVNAAINPVTALVRATNRVVIENPYARRVAESIAREAARVASAEGVNIGDPWGEVQRVAGATSRNKSSMLQDIESCRRTEADAILGEIVKRARMHGIPTPTTEAVYSLVKAAESECANP